MSEYLFIKFKLTNITLKIFHFLISIHSLLLQLHIHPQSGCELSSPQKDGTGEVTPFLWLEEGDEMLNRMPMSVSKLHRDSPVIKSVLIAEF